MSTRNTSLGFRMAAMITGLLLLASSWVRADDPFSYLAPPDIATFAIQVDYDAGTGNFRAFGQASTLDIAGFSQNGGEYDLGNGSAVINDIFDPYNGYLNSYQINGNIDSITGNANWMTLDIINQDPMTQRNDLIHAMAPADGTTGLLLHGDLAPGGFVFDNLGQIFHFDFDNLTGALAADYGTNAGSILSFDGFAWDFSSSFAGSGNSYSDTKTITAVPEPGAAGVVMAGLPILLLYRNRRRAAREVMNQN